MFLDHRPYTSSRTVRILGTHGVPASYGGFETAAENVGLHLAASGWRVIVYCQGKGRGPITTDSWRGLERVTIPVDLPGWRGTSKFDSLAAVHAARHDDICLVFGYNTAVVNTVQRLHNTPLVFNMDGIEWSRKRWGRTRQAILYANERIACLLGNALIADHPGIERYLERHARTSKITMIPYGANAVVDAPTEPVESLGLEPGRYLSLICRPIPENSILEIVRGFSRRRRDVQLLLLGDYDATGDEYHRQVKDAASDEVLFAGSIFQPEITRALRFHSLAYLHGHTVGGTNPSLVEAMAAGNPVIAHDNEFNRWVADACAVYFSTEDDVDRSITSLLPDSALRSALSETARSRHADLFTWERVAGQYEDLLSQYLASNLPTAIQPMSVEEA